VDLSGVLSPCVPYLLCLFNLVNGVRTKGPGKRKKNKLGAKTKTSTSTTLWTSSLSFSISVESSGLPSFFSFSLHCISVSFFV